MVVTCHFTKVFKTCSIVLMQSKIKTGTICQRSAQRIGPRISFTANCRSNEWLWAFLSRHLVPSGPREPAIRECLLLKIIKRLTVWRNYLRVSKNSAIICGKLIISGLSTCTPKTLWHNAWSSLKSTLCRHFWRIAQICFINCMWSLWPLKRRTSLNKQPHIWQHVTKPSQRTTYHLGRKSPDALVKRVSNIWTKSNWTNERRKRCLKTTRLDL